jgi:hypothetical protein
VAGLALLAATVACAQERIPEVDRSLLLGPWTSNGGSFDFVIGEETILYEFDMREHPYTLEGNVLVVDFEDPVLGVQRKEILRLTPEELELRDPELDDSPTLYRRVE